MKLKIFLLLILLVPLVYAGNYGEGNYSEGDYVGEEASSATPESPGDSGGSPGGGSSGSGGSSTPSCNYDWECTGWIPSICPESRIQERICVNKGSCTGTSGIPAQTRTCEYTGPPGPLFDIFLTLSNDYKEICSGDDIEANINLENYGKIELLDAFMTYWIIDENNKLIAELKDTRAVEKETNFNIQMKIPKSTVQGTYRLYSQITYNGNKTAVTGESFEVLSLDDCAPSFTQDFDWNYLIYGFIGFIILLFVFIYRKKILGKKVDKHPKESLNGLFKKKVYSEEGNFIGKVDNIILGKGKIDSLMIILSNKYNFKFKGIVIKYEYVKTVGHIVIVDEVVFKDLLTKNLKIKKSY
ncbi:MAG: PRC-barrel domain-containing protein [Nanoarchaeota archaeon]|nr:PRC-barrel domain-containing protein [Nanoarchaeota archaeon]